MQRYARDKRESMMAPLPVQEESNSIRTTI